MRIGEKCIFTVDMAIKYGNCNLKPNHRYTGHFGGEKTVVYKGMRLTANTVESIKKPTVKKEKAPTASDYKNFGDTAFECGVRYRDGWGSVLSGKKFEEGEWNGLQAGHGCSRAYWDTRHMPQNCHAITSGENYAMSIGNATTIIKYWEYVKKACGEFYMNTLVNMKHETTKLSIAYLKSDCEYCYDFLTECLDDWNKTAKTKRTAAEVIKMRCEKYPKAKADGVLKVLKLIQEGIL